MSSKNSCHVCQSLYVCVLAHSWSSDTAQQLTCMVRRHMPQVCIHFECRSLISSYVLCWRFCFLFPPNSLSSISFPSPFFPDTSVSDTSVSSGQVSTTPTSFGVISKYLKYFIYIEAYFKFHACVKPNPQPGSAAVGK